MKKLMMMAVAAVCALPTMAEAGDSLVFETVIANPVTSIKNQNNSGTCWCYSSLAFLESEAMKKNPKIKDLDLCESFVVNKTYIDRADRNVRTHGDASFSQGGSFYDVIYCMANYGLIPEGNMPYPNTLYGDSLFNFTSFFPPMEAYIKAIAKSDAKKINPMWKKDVQGMIDNYFGKCPETFKYEGKTYTPQTFVKDYLKLDPNDYVSLTSYTHHPFYSSFILEIQDNWRWGSSYNLPLDELMRVMDEAVKNGWTFAWGADVSEEGFSRRTGKNRCVATVPDTKSNAGVGSDQSKWTGEKAGAKISVADGAGEKTITQEMRQLGYDNWTTTDDHGMQIYGIAKDQNGKEYFMMKNSWGEYGPYKGFWYVSKPYAAYKTMNIVINKNAVPKDIRKKLGI
ncbi:MAG: aminopeptidase [Bacteroidaceae bacterium]|jgi:aminopeptidase C|nr:aminopeptidase [Bacteroidaceae bacterium]